MDCPKCHSPGVLVERIDNHTKRVKCSSCGLNEVRDERNLPLLTEIPSQTDRRALSS